ncbi:MAG TPA: hydroxysqualene dehydroxylase HpnE [Alphaproteobacteria bacterium]|nr:hydroxysqualene dehydroxylase HpnE [Alphaproteobacteria bacterium]
MAGRVAVVGAGLAGLAAALDLQARGYEVEVFERTRLLGGRATSFEVGGREIDNGQHVFLHCCDRFIAFVESVGMGHALREQPRFEALVLARDGTSSRLRAASLPAPFHLLASFAGYAHLDVGGRLRVARALAGAAIARHPDPNLTFDRWLEKNGQNAATRRAFWDPFFIPALNASFDRVSATDALFVISTAFLRNAAAARFGFSTVPLAHVAAAAAARISAVHLSTAVLAMNVDDDGIELQLSGDRAVRFDAVVLAVSPRTTAKLLGSPERLGVNALETYDPYPIVDVHLWHDRGALGFDFAAVLDSPLQWIFEKDEGYVCCSISAAGEVLTVPTSELERLAWQELCAFVPALRGGRVLHAAATRNPEATYLPRPGSPRTLQRTAHPRVAIAGSWTQTGWPDTMESAVRSGNAAAEAIAHG